MEDNLHKKIIELIIKYSEKKPDQRFGQLIFNLGINEFMKDYFQLRDIYNDSDEEILKRIEYRLEWFDLQERVSKNIETHKDFISAMTVNERLYITNLMSDFDKYKIEKPEFAKFILERLKIDSSTIDLILQNK